MSSKEKNYKKIMIITIVTSIIVILGTVSGTIAKWSFTANNKTDTFDLNLGELYPGKSGTHNITLSATNSDLDVYYELIFTYPGGNTINGFLYWDSSYTKPLVSSDGSYVGKYGVITKGSSVTIPIYLDWPYGDTAEEYYEPLSMPEIKVIAKQYTGYNGSIPMNLLGFTNLVSYNVLKENFIIPVAQETYDKYGYSFSKGYKFETTNATSGYILNGSF